MRLFLIALLFAISYAQTAESCTWGTSEADKTVDGNIITSPGGANYFADLASMDACKALCDTYNTAPKCVGATWSTNNNRCWLRSDSTGLITTTDNYRVAAFKLCQSSTSTTSTTTTSAATPTTTTTTTSAATPTTTTTTTSATTSTTTSAVGSYFTLADSIECAQKMVSYEGWIPLAECQSRCLNNPACTDIKFNTANTECYLFDGCTGTPNANFEHYVRIPGTTSSTSSTAATTTTTSSAAASLTSSSSAASTTTSSAAASSTTSSAAASTTTSSAAASTTTSSAAASTTTSSAAASTTTSSAAASTTTSSAAASTTTSSAAAGTTTSSAAGTTTSSAAATTSSSAATTTSSASGASALTSSTSTSAGAATTTTSAAASTTSSVAASTTSSGAVSTTSSGAVSTTSSGAVSTTSSGAVSTTSSGAVSTTSSGAVSTTTSGAASTTSSGAVSTTSSGAAITTSTTDSTATTSTTTSSAPSTTTTTDSGGLTSTTTTTSSILGSSYCTWAPLNGCFASGWPACCVAGDGSNCPEERPTCDTPCSSTSVCDLGTEGCTPSTPCGAYQGDCDTNADCAGDLVCMADAVTGMHSGGGVNDYCVPPASTTSGGAGTSTTSSGAGTSTTSSGAGTSTTSSGAGTSTTSSATGASTTSSATGTSTTSSATGTSTTSSGAASSSTALSECASATCGTECLLGFTNGVCDGQGSCVDVLTNPCSPQGCGGLSCGDQCLVGDIMGFCDNAGDCQFTVSPDCGTDSTSSTPPITLISTYSMQGHYRPGRLGLVQLQLRQTFADVLSVDVNKVTLNLSSNKVEWVVEDSTDWQANFQSTAFRDTLNNAFLGKPPLAAGLGLTGQPVPVMCGMMKIVEDCWGYARDPEMEVGEPFDPEESMVCTWMYGRCIAGELGEAQEMPEGGGMAGGMGEGMAPGGMKLEDYCPTLTRETCHPPCVLMGSPPMCHEMDVLQQPHQQEESKKTHWKFVALFAVAIILASFATFYVHHKRRSRELDESQLSFIRLDDQL